MKWTKINPETNEPVKKGVNGFFPNDYISGNFRIINNSWSEKMGWILISTNTNQELGRYSTLKAAKARAEEVLPLAEFI